MACSKEADPTDMLWRNLAEMPRSIVQFSKGLRQLYSQDAGNTESENTTSFCQIRDMVRIDAAIYSTKVMPLAQVLVGNIQTYFDKYVDREYDDCWESLDEIIQAVEGYATQGRLLQQMHAQLIVRLKERQMVENSIQERDQLSQQMADKVKDLQDREKDYKDASNTKSPSEPVAQLGGVLTPVTEGASLVEVAATVSEATFVGSQMINTENGSLVESGAAEKKTEIMRETAHLTRRELIPAIEQFLQGVQACNNFFVVTGKNLGEIKNNAAAAEKKKMAEKKIKKEFQIMKLKAEDIRINCDIFFSAASEVRIKTNYCKIY